MAPAEALENGHCFLSPVVPPPLPFSFLPPVAGQEPISSSNSAGGFVHCHLWVQLCSFPALCLTDVQSTSEAPCSRPVLCQLSLVLKKLPIPWGCSVTSPVCHSATTVHVFSIFGSATCEGVLYFSADGPMKESIWRVFPLWFLEVIPTTVDQASVHRILGILLCLAKERSAAPLAPPRACLPDEHLVCNQSHNNGIQYLCLFPFPMK